MNKPPISPVVSEQIETNKLLARRFLDEIVGGGRLALLDEIVSPDAIDRTQRTPTDDGQQGEVMSDQDLLAMRHHIRAQVHAGDDCGSAGIYTP